MSEHKTHRPDYRRTALTYARRYPQHLLHFLTKDNYRVAKGLWGNKPWYLGDQLVGYPHDKARLSFWTHDKSKVPVPRKTLPSWEYHLQNMDLLYSPEKYIEETT